VLKLIEVLITPLQYWDIWRHSITNTDAVVIRLKSDIYSFGVILGVLVSGKFPNNDFFMDRGCLDKWINNLMKSGNLKDAIDARQIDNHQH
jgi:hypothetical protein